MERGPLHEIEDIKSSPPIMDSKCDSPMKSDDKENIPFEVTNKCSTRRSVLRSFDPLYSSPGSIKKMENADEVLHFTTAIHEKKEDTVEKMKLQENKFTSSEDAFKSNKELNSAQDKTQIEINKLKAIIKRLEIKNASLVNALEQKTNECTALAALCNEVAGHVE